MAAAAAAVEDEPSVFPDEYLDGGDLAVNADSVNRPAKPRYSAEWVEPAFARVACLGFIGSDQGSAMKCTSRGSSALIATMSCGQADKTTTQCISARRST